MFLKRSNLELLFNPQYLQRGMDYFSKGMVSKVESHQDGQLITATVRGSGRKSYYSQIRLDVANNQVIDIHGSCSCPVHFNCKHVAAALLKVIDSQQPLQDDLFGRPAISQVEQLKSAQHNFLTKKATIKASADVLLYLLNINHLKSGNYFRVQTVKTRLLPNGRYAAASHYSASIPPRSYSRKNCNQLRPSFW